jgi:hypothetical protein
MKSSSIKQYEKLYFKRLKWIWKVSFTGYENKTYEYDNTIEVEIFK